MKINNKKIVVPALAMAMAAALAGSIAGSVAWYQYSTRATSMLTGTTAGTSRSLQLANTLVNPEALDNLDDGNWGYNYAPAGKEDFAPIAPVFQDGNVLGFVSHPVYQHFNSWKKAPEANYFSYDLYFQSLDNFKGEREELDIYLTAYQLNVENNDPAGRAVIEKALRVELVPETFNGSEWIKGSPFLLSKDGGKTEMNDYLDLNGNQIMDHDGFAADDSDGFATKYIANTPVEVTAADDLQDHYLDSKCKVPAWSNEVTKAIGDSGEGLFLDAELTQAAPVDGDGNLTAAGKYYEKVSHEYHPAADTIIKNCYTDAALTTPVPEFTSNSYTVGQPGEGLFTDNTLTTPVEIDADGNLVADGTYYSHAIADGSETFYVLGKDAITNAFVKNESEYTTKAFNDVLVNDDDPYEFSGKAAEKVIVKTSKHYAVKVTVKVWLEGWQKDEASAINLAEGSELVGYYNNDDFSTPAWFNEVDGHAGEDGKGLFEDNEFRNKAKVDNNGKLLEDGTYYSRTSRAVTPAEDEDLSNCYTDERLTVKANNYHAVAGHVGESGAGLFTDPDLKPEHAAPVDGEGKLTADGTYYKAGADDSGSTYYVGGADSSADYYAKDYIWNNESLGSNFNLGLRFAVEAEQ